jgi:hypothetical protein
MTTLDKNILIAEFLGYKKRGHLYFASSLALKLKLKQAIFVGDNTDSFQFHNDWNWIMPVLVHIETLGYMSCIEKFNRYDTHRVFFVTNDHVPYARGARGQTKIEAIFEAVVDLIEYYNRDNTKEEL